MKKALLWKLLERFGVQGAQFILQIILARLLDPEHYGVLSLMIIFTTLANVFVQRGFNTSLVQNKDVTEEDYSSVFWVSLGIAGVLYSIIFFASPWIGVFFNMPSIVAPLRVLALMLFPGALNSVQLAKVSREMDFRQVFFGNVGGIVVSGVAGIVIALLGGGLWALVAQTLLNVVVACMVMAVTVKWRIRFVCNLRRVKVLFAYGWKLLVASLLDTLYTDLNSLIIGKKYNSTMLAYDTRGKQFPQFLMNAIAGAIQSVMLSAMSAAQDEKAKVKSMLRNSVLLSSYVVFPMMAGLAGVSTAFVTVVLTEKWLECVPFLQVYCLNLAFYPIAACDLQAINAVGRSDIFLKLEVWKKVGGLCFLVAAVMLFDSPLAIAISAALFTPIGLFINAFPLKKLISYSFKEQLKDIMPTFVVSILMYIGVMLIGQLNIPVFLMLMIQIVVGVVLYIGLSVIFKLEAFQMLITQLKKKFTKKA